MIGRGGWAPGPIRDVGRKLTAGLHDSVKRLVTTCLAANGDPVILYSAARDFRIPSTPLPEAKTSSQALPDVTGESSGLEQG